MTSGFSSDIGRDATDTALAAEANFGVHVGWAPARVPGMRVDDTLDLLRVDSGLACDTFNFACRARLHEQPPARIAEVVRRFGGRPFSWWVGPTDEPADLGRALLDAGFEAAESELAMAADLTSLAGAPVPEGLRIERVRTEAGLLAFAEVLAANWTPPDADVPRFYQSTAAVLLDPRCPLRFYVGYVDDVPVAAAECTVGGGVAGLYNIATLTTWRGRGFGSALTLRPLLDARADGLRTAILQAAPDGVGVYRRLGFAQTGTWTEYKLPRA